MASRKERAKIAKYANQADRLQAMYPEGIPNWMLERGYSFTKICQLMNLRRMGFPSTKKAGGAR